MGQDLVVEAVTGEVAVVGTEGEAEEQEEVQSSNSLQKN